MQNKLRSFEYQREEKSSLPASTLQNESTYTLVFWVLGLSVAVLLGGLYIYEKNIFEKDQSQKQASKDLSSLQFVDIDPVLVRVTTSTGLVIRKVNTRFFVNDIRVKNELNNNQNQFKEYLIFMLSNVDSKKFVNNQMRQNLQEEIRGYINSFLSNGKIQQIEIKSQLI